MQKDAIALATRLLVKAQGTTFDAEAAALTGKAYRLLAEVLNAYDDTTPSTGATRKRERRHLRDRRSTVGSIAPSTPRRATEPDAAHIRRSDWVHLPSRGHVDLMI
jgi:hypothetical protein